MVGVDEISGEAFCTNEVLPGDKRRNPIGTLHLCVQELKRHRRYPCSLKGFFRKKEAIMATGWAGDGAVQDQIDATIKDGIKRARTKLGKGPGLKICEECDAKISEARRKAVPGVRLCVTCQDVADRSQHASANFNRRGSKDSQLR